MLPTPADVKVEGMPPIPQSIADGLARYAQFRQAQLMAWHPAKRQIAHHHVISGPRAADSPRRRAGPGPSPVDVVSRAGRPQVMRRSVIRSRGREHVRLSVRSRRRRAAIAVPVRHGHRRNHRSSPSRRPAIAHVWSRQGKWLAFDSAERNGKDRDLYVIQPSDPKTKRRLAEFEGAFSPQDWSPDGTSLLANEVVGNAETLSLAASTSRPAQKTAHDAAGRRESRLVQRALLARRQDASTR